MNIRFLKQIALLLFCLALPISGQNLAAQATNQQNQQSTQVQQPTLPRVNLSITPVDGQEDYAVAIQVLVVLTILSFGPAFVTMMTSFTRIVVVFFFMRSAMGTQQSPPNQVLVGLALFLTIFIMKPVADQINQTSIQPYLEEQITQQQALDAAAEPIKNFMIKQTREKDLLLFMDLGQVQSAASIAELPLWVVVPAYVVSELRIAFQIGFLIYLPFLVIDLVVSSILLAMGIVFLPPILVSLPFKILIFVLTDGWYLIVDSLIRSFN